MSYMAGLGKLLEVLQEKSPVFAASVAENRTNIEDGKISVGLKIHSTITEEPFMPLIERFGGKHQLEMNMYRHALARFCMVLPPLGNAESAIALIKSIERFVDHPLFMQPGIQIQVCSPGRLSPWRSAMLGIGYYLGSSQLRRYTVDDFETTASDDAHYSRGKRLVVYDAGGGFERRFEWWARKGNRREIHKKLPFESGRSDLLVVKCTEEDVRNINLVATLLVHAQFGGFWGTLGERFENDMTTLLERHLLSGLLNAPWVTETNGVSTRDRHFKDALGELVAYVFDESTRMQKIVRQMKGGRVPDSAGILVEMQQILKMYRDLMREQCRNFDKGERR